MSDRKVQTDPRHRQRVALDLLDELADYEDERFAALREELLEVRASLPGWLDEPTGIGPHVFIPPEPFASSGASLIYVAGEPVTGTWSKGRYFPVPADQEAPDA